MGDNQEAFGWYLERDNGMTSHGGITRKDCRDPKKIIKYAERNGVLVTQGKGDHMKLEKNGKHETFYTSRELSTGVQHQVWKYFVGLGLAITIIFYVVGGAI